jgi:hypothetical protein
MRVASECSERAHNFQLTTRPYVGFSKAFDEIHHDLVDQGSGCNIDDDVFALRQGAPVRFESEKVRKPGGGIDPEVETAIPGLGGLMRR